MFDSASRSSSPAGVYSMDPADSRLPHAGMVALLDALDVSPRHVGLLAGLDLDVLDEVSRLTVLKVWHRVAGWVAAQEQRAIVAVAGREERGGGSECPDVWCAEEVGAALRLSPVAAGKRISAARQLTGRLADTGSALAAGRVSYWHAAHLAEALEEHTDALAAVVQAVVLPKAAGQTGGQFRRSVAQAIAAADPAALSERHARAARWSDVQVWAEPDGMAGLLARGPAPAIYEVYDQICWQAAAARDAARKGGSAATGDSGAGAASAAGAAEQPCGLVDEVSIGELRFEAFLARIAGIPGSVTEGQPGAGTSGGVPGGPTGAPPGARRQVGILLDLPTALALAEHPGEIPGYGPIPAELARRLAADADWHAWVLDAASSQLSALGTKAYRPTARLKQFVQARDRTCLHPGCAQPAWRCDIDHAVPHGQGGCTDPANCGCFCRRHHRLKHESDWRMARDPDGTVHWTSRLGQQRTVHPADYDLSPVFRTVSVG